MKLAGIRRRALVFVLAFVVGAVPAATRAAPPPEQTAISADVVSEEDLVADGAGDVGQNEYSVEERPETVELAAWGTMTSIFDGIEPRETAYTTNDLLSGGGDDDDDDDDDDDNPLCDLLNDPATRAKLSSAFEVALMIHCFPNQRHRAPEAILPCGGNEPGSDPVTGNVLVNEPAEDFDTFRAQSETSVAVNPNTGTICVGYNDYGPYTGTDNDCDPACTGFSKGTFSLAAPSAYSFEDKGPFSEVTVIDGPGSTTWEPWADPSLVWREADSSFYFSAVVIRQPDYDQGAVALWRSTDDCETFSPVQVGGSAVLVHEGPADDKPLMAVDNNDSSPHYGNLYVAWADFSPSSSCPQCLFLATSEDSGQSWSNPPKNLTTAEKHVQGAWPVVAPNGNVYVAWVYADPWFKEEADISIEIALSTDGGNTIDVATVTNPMTNQVIPGSGNCAGFPCLKGSIKTPPLPQLAVSDCTPNCELHAVYMYDPDGFNQGDQTNAYYRRSTDGGNSWRPEVVLNDNQDHPDIPTDQWHPSIGVGPSGYVVTSWYDRRRDSDDPPGSLDNNCWFDRFATVSYNGGKNWNGHWPNIRVSDRASQVYRELNFYHSDYEQLIQDPVHGDYACVFWGGAVDDLVPDPPSFDQDVWSQVIPLPELSLIDEIFWDGFESGSVEVWDSWTALP